VATLRVARDELVIGLGPLEQLAALRRRVRVPLCQLRSVTTEADPWSALRGVRAPGTGIPGVVAYGVRRMTGEAPDFAAVRGLGPAVLIECGSGARFARLVVSVADPEAAVREIRARSG